MTSSTIKNIQKVLNSEIPLTHHMGVQVVEFSDLFLTLTAPLENNINHKNTAFGGSLFSVSVLAGWGLIYLLLQKYHLSGHIVIQESQIKYLKPVTNDLTATSSFESKQQQDKLINMYKRKGVARIHLESKIYCNNQLAVNFTGSYVIHN